jgi:hypothetical protein
MSFQVFISYSQYDKAVADATCAKLESDGIRCWIAPRDVPPSAEWGAAIINGIDQCKVMVLVFSTGANESPQVMREVERAVSKGLILLPVRIEDILPSRSMEYFIGAVHWLDAISPPLENHLDAVSNTVANLLSRGDVAAEADSILPNSKFPIRRSSSTIPKLVGQSPIGWATLGLVAITVLLGVGSYWKLSLRSEEPSTTVLPLDALKEMAEAMKRLAASGGLVSNPKTPAEFYHNARILGQRGEVDLAMTSYEQLLKFPILYADPVIDLMTLATRTYGKDGAKSYLDKTFKSLMPNNFYLLASQIIADEPLVELEALLSEDKLSYPPLASYFVERTPKYIGMTKSPPRHLARTAFKAIDIVKSSYDSGVFLSFFLDQIRGEQIAKKTLEFDQTLPVAYKERLNRSVQLDIWYRYVERRLANVYISDQIDHTKPIKICFLSKAAIESCGDPSTYGIFDPGTGVSGGWTNISLEADQCIFSVSYYDIRGFFYTLKQGDVRYQFEVDFSFGPTHRLPLNGIPSLDTDFIISCYGSLNAKSPITLLTTFPKVWWTLKLALAELGFLRGLDLSRSNDIYDEATKEAVALWQRSRNFDTTGFLSYEQYFSLLVEGYRRAVDRANAMCAKQENRDSGECQWR